MQLTQTREHLLAALQTTLGAIEKRHTSPILENVLLRIQNTQCHWCGTDLEIEIALHTPLIDGNDGAITLPARKFADICKLLPANSLVTLLIDKDQRAHIHAGRSRFELPTLPASDFPELDDLGETLRVDVPETPLKRLLDSTAFAMANQDVRYYLNGLLLEITAEGLRAVATDGHRLALAFYPEPLSHLENSRQIIIPRKGVLELARLLESDSEVAVQLEISQNHLRVRRDNLCFTTKLIDGRYPDYRAAIPASGHIQVDLDRKTFKESLNRVAILANEKFRRVRLSLSHNLLQVQAHNPEEGIANDELDVAYNGDDFNIGFNVTYLLDAVNHLDGDTLRLHCNTPESSALLIDPYDDNVRHVIMPIRL